MYEDWIIQLHARQAYYRYLRVIDYQYFRFSILNRPTKLDLLIKIDELRCF